jgi:IS5 family transposase
VEWPFRILKRIFGFTKVRYRGLQKNHQWLLAAFALVHLYQHRKRWSRWGRSVSAGWNSASRDKNNPVKPALGCDLSRNFGCNCFRTSLHRNHAAK